MEPHEAMHYLNVMIGELRLRAEAIEARMTRLEHANSDLRIIRTQIKKEAAGEECVEAISKLGRLRQ